MSSERRSGTVGLTTTLQYQFTKWKVPYDPYSITKVEIYPSENDAINNTNRIQTILSTAITKIGIGLFEYEVSAIATAGVYFDKIYLVPDSGEAEWVDIEDFAINPATIPPVGESRKGYGFNNPDLTSNGGWGAILTPDELRWIYSFGNELVAPNYQTITDETLKWYIDTAIANIERDLNVTLMKRIYKYRPIQGQTRIDLGDAEPGVDFEWDEPYDFDSKMMEEYLYITLRHRPILTLDAAEWKDMTGATVTPILDWARVNYEKGSLQFFPTGGSLASLPLSMGIGLNLFGRVTGGRGKYPDAFYFDYTAGFATVAHLWKKWSELFMVVGKLAAINLLNDYGDGRSPGLASSSVSLSGISESYSTTQSATNALYGARLIAFSKELSEWYKRNKNKYGGVLFGVL